MLNHHYGNIGVTEGEFVIMFLCLITGTLGSDFWLTKLSQLLPSFLHNILPTLILNAEARQIVLAGTYFNGGLSVIKELIFTLKLTK